MAPEQPPVTETLQLLKGEYVRLLNELDVLTNWGRPQLEALYATHIGVHQLEHLQLQLAIQALKRKTELVHAAINAGTLPDIAQIEAYVGTELAAAEEQIMAQAAGIEAARQVLAHLDTPQRSADLRKTFRELARQLHPDANPDLPFEYAHIWHEVRDAYERGDLERLKALQIVYQQELAALKQNETTLTEAEISLQCATLKAGIKVLMDSVKSMRASFPFTLEEQLKDDAWIAAKQAELQQETKQLQEYEASLKAAYEALIGSVFN